MKIRIAILIFILFCSSSCKKYGDGYVKGTIYEKGFGTSYYNAVVYLQRWKHGDKGFVPDEILDSVITNSSGEYYFSFHKKAAYGYAIHCKPYDFFTDNSISLKTYFELKNKETIKDVVMCPTAYMKIHLQKNSSSENYIVLFFNAIDGPTIWLPNYDHPFDTILPIYKVKANDTIYLEWFQISLGSPYSVKHTDTLCINKGDTIPYDIIYF